MKRSHTARGFGCGGDMASVADLSLPRSDRVKLRANKGECRPEVEV
jgi:hypothetical protein